MQIIRQILTLFLINEFDFDILKLVNIIDKIYLIGQIKMLQKVKHLWHTSERFRTAMSAVVGVLFIQYSWLLLPNSLVLPFIAVVYLAVPFFITKGRYGKFIQ